jgi:cytochrome c oxidase subunit 2
MLFADAPFLPEQASTIAERVDALCYFLLAVTGFFTVMIFFFVIVFAVKYRRRSAEERPHRIAGSLRLEIVWTVVPLSLALVMFGWGASVFFSMSRPPDDALEVYVVARQWMWHLQHPGGQREINRLHVPVGRPVKLTMASEDVIHGFYVPAFRINQDVVPGRYTTVWFEATRTGTYDFSCSQYCGTDHSVMTGKVIVLRRDEYEAWLAREADESLAHRGRKLFQKLQCVACHSGDAKARAPVLEEIHGKTVNLQDGRSVTADDDYLRESILEPGTKIVAGYRPIMRSYAGQVSEEELLQLLAFLKQLRRGQTPPRVEQAEPPAASNQEQPPEPSP